MVNKILTLLIIISFGISLYNSNYVYSLESHKTCPDTGKKTKYTACIQDPGINDGFLVSVSSIQTISKIQSSLNKNDFIYTIRKINSDYIIENNINKKKQFIVKCNSKNKDMIMKKFGTKDIYSST